MSIAALTQETELAPVLFHVHGVGRHDFSALAADDLADVQREAARRKLDLVPTIFLRHEWLDRCCALLWRYHLHAEEFPNILGFAMEGPLLGSEGGTPRSASWMPTIAEWHEIASLGPLGLRYLVLAPDAMEPDELIGPAFSLADLVGLLYANGIKIALGHFSHDDPQRSARRAMMLIELVEANVGASPFNVLTDHLYNDMPREFTHAWRGADLDRREAELNQFLATPWSAETIEQLLGPVPAALLEAARCKRLLPCMNFDGAHVDIGICRRTVDYLGAENLIAITDHIEHASMAGEALHTTSSSTLWYRDDEIVAAGSLGVERQTLNMRTIGMTEPEIAMVLSRNPRRAIEAPAAA